MTTQSTTYLRNHLSDAITQVNDTHEEIIITQQGKPVAVLISSEDFASIIETLYISQSPANLVIINQGDEEFQHNQWVEWRP